MPRRECALKGSCSAKASGRGLGTAYQPTAPEPITINLESLPSGNGPGQAGEAVRRVGWFRSPVTDYLIVHWSIEQIR